MAYNIGSVRIVSGALRIEPDKARAFVAAHADDLPEIHFLAAVVEKATTVKLESACWNGAASGRSFELFQEALAMCDGEADLVVTWEDGDSFSGLRVNVGGVTEMDVAFRLVPHGEGS